ncbi:MAG: hypothetical protein IJ829_01055, partial [Kiritimatiellae bacterium]|nr:hypothetical protein [Kiritimatiellia bacterium]
VLQITGEAAPGAKVTAMFDPEVVEGYRRTVASDGGRVTIVYELMAFAGREIAPKDVFATLVWPSKDGDANTPLAVGP